MCEQEEICQSLQRYTRESPPPYYLKPYRYLVKNHLIPTSQPGGCLHENRVCHLLYDIREAVSERFLEVALENRQLELNLLWQRSLFFWGFIVAAIAAIPNLIHEDPRLLTLVTGFGVVASIGWVMVNLGSKYWTENWETKLFLNPEIKTLFQPLTLSKKAPWAIRFSVSKLMTAFSALVTFLWLAAFIRQLNIIGICSNFAGFTLFVVIIAVLLLFLLSIPED